MQYTISTYTYHNLPNAALWFYDTMCVYYIYILYKLYIYIWWYHMIPYAEQNVYVIHVWQNDDPRTTVNIKLKMIK